MDTRNEKESKRASRKALDNRIWSLTLPAVVSNVTVPLLGLSDTAVSGHLGSAACIAAMALGAMMLNVVTWLCGFLRMGTTGLTAVAFGAQNSQELWKVLVRGVVIGLLIGIATVIASRIIIAVFLDISSPTPEIGVLAARYFSIAVWGIPAVLAVMAMSGWMVGMQNTVLPMITAIVTNIVNVAFSITAVFLLDMGFEGIAFGTLVANWVGFVLALLFVRKIMRGREKTSILHVLKGEGWMRYFNVNATLFMRSLCVMSVSVAMTSVASRLGEAQLGANAVLMQFFVFFSFVMDGLAFAAEALTGKFIGESNGPMLRFAVGRLLMWSGIMASVFTIVYCLYGTDLMQLLTDVDSVVEMARSHRLWIDALPVITVGAFIFDGFYIGMVRTGPMLLATGIGMSVFAMLCFIHFGNGGFYIGLPDYSMLWTAFLSWLATRGAVLALLLRHNVAGALK